MISAPGHDYGEWTSNDGQTHQRVCSRNASHIEKEACADENKDHKCDICGKVLSDCTDTNNDHNCDTCGKKLTDHTFTAEKTDEKYLKSAVTCTEQAVYFKSCAICGEKGTETFASGTVDPDNHAEGCELTWTITDQTHKRAYSRCGKVVVSEEDHEFGDWFYDDAAYVYANGLMSGTSAYRFSPDLSTTRAMIVTILWRLEGEPVVNFAMRFADVSPDKWYGEAIHAQTAAMLHRFCEDVLK